MEYGKRIKEARLNAKITQKGLAGAIGKSVSSVQKYEMDLATPPIDILKKIAAALDTDISWLVSGVHVADVEELSKWPIASTPEETDAGDAEYLRIMSKMRAEKISPAEIEMALEFVKLLRKASNGQAEQ